LSDDIELTQTCYACPEQYDALLSGEVVGYLRLRHGYFSVRCPGPEGEEVYFNGSDEIGDGIFASEEIRKREINTALHAIRNWLQKERVKQ
jgi:hypothetical protein